MVWKACPSPSTHPFGGSRRPQRPRHIQMGDSLSGSILRNRERGNLPGLQDRAPSRIVEDLEQHGVVAASQVGREVEVETEFAQERRGTADFTTVYLRVAHDELVGRTLDDQ